MQGNQCKKGKSCPYRHSVMARDSPVVCTEWKERMCLNMDCPMKHPGNKEPSIVVESKQDGLACGGRCGVAKCRSCFESEEALAQHVEESQLLKCPYCSSVYQSDSEFVKHLQSCCSEGSSTHEGAESGMDHDTNNRTPNLGEVGGRVGRQRSHFGGEAVKSNRTGQHEASRSASSSSDYQHIGNVGGGAAGYSDSHADIDLASLEYSYDSDDDVITYSKGEIARPLSLNERDMQEEEEEEEEEEEDEEIIPRSKMVDGLKAGTGASKHSTSSSSRKDKKPSSSPTHAHAKEPVGVFWDIENCSIPPNKSAFSVASKLRKEFISGKREAEFMCVCDITKERKEVTDDLNKAQVTLVHVNAIAKNAADDKLRQSLRRFANTYPPPATVVLISGDVNFSTELNDLVNCHNLTAVLVHNTQAADALKAFASRLVNYDHFIEDVEPPSKQQNPSDFPRVVAVKGLPKHMGQGPIVNRLGRLSDNCGGKVLQVDLNSGTAKILFRTNDWAIKAQKRMNNEDVFGYKISTSVEMEPHPPSHPNSRGSHSNFQNLVGPALGQSYPPLSQKPPNQVPAPYRTPPLPARHNMGVQPPRPIVQPRPAQPLPPIQHHYQRALMAQPLGQPYPMQPNGRPLMRGLGPMPGGRGMPPFDPRVRPGIIPLMPMQHPMPQVPIRGSRPALLVTTNQLPRFKHPPCANIKSLPVGPIPRHEGRILVFKVMPDQEVHMEQNVLSLQSDAFFSAQHRVLWHSYSEIQVLFKLDFIQTAMIRKEEIIQALYEKGDLPVKIAEEFVETCTKSIADVLRRHNCNWEVTMCGWTAEEEENRIVRSNALTILRSRQPSTWINFGEFKQLYQHKYATAISELSIHTACAGAVQILSSSSSSGNSNKNQVVIIYEFSPLVKIVNDVKLHEKLQGYFSRFLSMQPQRRIKLLDFVAAYWNSKVGPLPLSPSGKILQDIVSSAPNVELEGEEPASTYVILRHPAGAVKPRDISGLTANFHKLLKSKGKEGIPAKFFQQDYQTFFHHSFRVSDYLPDANGMPDLLKAIPGVRVANLTLPNGKKDRRVLLGNSSIPSTIVPAAGPSQSPVPRHEPQQQHAAAAPAAAPVATLPIATLPVTRSEGATKMRPMSEINDNFCELLRTSPDGSLPFWGFQQRYQTHFHVSFRISTYMTGDVKMRDLLEACPGVVLVMVNGEQYVCLAEEVEAIRSLSRSTGQISIPKPQVPIPRPVSASPVKVPSASNRSVEQAQASAGESVLPTDDSISEFRKDCIQVLLDVDGHCLLAQFPEHYQRVKGVKFLPSIYKAKKLLQLLECIADCVQVFNDNREMKLLRDLNKQCEEELVMLLYAQKDHAIALDHLMSTYEAIFGRKLIFHGHKRLMKLLESFPDSLKVSGSGCDRPVSLTPVRLFSCEMNELLPRYPVPMPINKIVPSYKEHFGKDFVITNYGHPKLIKLLEAIPDVLEIKGSGATRTTTLRNHRSKLLPPRKTSFAPDPLSPDLVVDEITALLLSTHSQKISLVELTKKYNTTFRSGSPQVDKDKLLEVIKKLPNFKVLGLDRLCYIYLAQEGKTPNTSPTKAVMGRQAGEAAAVDQKKPNEPAANTAQEQQGSGPQASGETLAKMMNGLDLNKETYKGGMPELAEDAGVTDFSDTDSTCSNNSWMEEGDEGKRMVNETRRMLLTHQEHAMTLTELVESFHAQEDPSNITDQTLYRYLDTESAGKKLQVSSFPGSLGASMVQLDSKDCLWKLGEDLLQLFVYRPTCDLTHPVSSLAHLYQECFSRKLVTAVYSAKDLEQVLKSKVLKTVINVDPKTKMCSPCESHKIQVLVSLLVELLFFKGDDCGSEDRVPTAYLRYFGAGLPLDCLNLRSVSELFKLPEVQRCIKCVTTKAKKLKPVLKPRLMFIEQIRHLLTVNHGFFALQQFSSLYTAEFGPPQSEDVSVLMRKGRLPYYGLKVVNYSSLKWAVWAPNAYPVPSHRQVVKKKLPPPALDFSVLDDHFFRNTEYNAIQREASCVIDRIDELPTATPLSGSNGGAGSSNPEMLPPVSEARSGPAFSRSTEAGLDGSSISSLVPHSTGNVDQADTDQQSDDESGMLAVAYDFLKDDPQLLARLSEQPEGTMAAIIDTSSMPEDDVKILAEVLDLQRLQDIPRKPITTSENLHGSSHKTREKLGDSGVSVPPRIESSTLGTGFTGSGNTSGLPLLLGGPVDFFKQGLDSDQVLDQLQKLKEASGGSLKPDQMNPFLDYFGELSSRELDRIDQLEAQSNPEKKVGNGEARKKKRNMAIRFPSQSKVASPPSSAIGRGPSLSDLKIPVGKLPVANFDDLSSSDESDGQGGPVKPFNREEFIREALKKTGQDVDVSDLLGDDDDAEVSGLSHPILAGSLLSTDDLSNLSKLDSALSDLESFLLREKGP